MVVWIILLAVLIGVVGALLWFRAKEAQNVASVTPGAQISHPPKPNVVKPTQPITKRTKGTEKKSTNVPPLPEVKPNTDRKKVVDTTLGKREEKVAAKAGEDEMKKTKPVKVTKEAPIPSLPKKTKPVQPSLPEIKVEKASVEFAVNIPDLSFTKEKKPKKKPKVPSKRQEGTTTVNAPFFGRVYNTPKPAPEKPNFFLREKKPAKILLHLETPMRTSEGNFYKKNAWVLWPIFSDIFFRCIFPQKLFLFRWLFGFYIK